MQLTIAKDMESLQKALLPLAKAGKTVALVPTMGALHAGHMRLVEEAKKLADVVVASVFVNPTQFGPTEDFDKYPRQLEEDAKKLDAAGVGILYAPSVEDIYPSGFITCVSVGPMGEILCGAFRPGHFDGVVTVVSKLFTRILPHFAVFGEKDYQQLCVIRRMAYDLDIPVEVVGVPTVREEDGLAMSSRNAYLSPEERKLAAKLYGTLLQAAARIAGKPANANDVISDTAAELISLGFKVDYVALCESDTLNPLREYKAPARLLAAVWLGKTRLIDNISLE